MANGKVRAQHQLLHFVPELHAELCCEQGSESFHTVVDNGSPTITFPVHPLRMEVPQAPAEWYRSSVSSDDVLGAICKNQPGTAREEAHAHYLANVAPDLYTPDLQMEVGTTEITNTKEELQEQDPHDRGESLRQGDADTVLMQSLKLSMGESAGMPEGGLDSRTVSLSRKKHLLGPIQSDADQTDEEPAHANGNHEPASQKERSEEVSAQGEDADSVQIHQIQLSNRSNRDSAFGDEGHLVSCASSVSSPDTHERDAMGRRPSSNLGSITPNGDDSSLLRTRSEDAKARGEDGRARPSWDGLMVGVEDLVRDLQKERSAVDTIKRNEDDQMRKSRGEETQEDRERAQLRKEARAKREAELLKRRFLHKSKVWKLNSKATGEKKEMWRLRLLMLDGGGNLSYVSEKDAGETTRVCTVTDMLGCEVVAQPHSLCFPFVFKVSYKGGSKDDKDKDKEIERDKVSSLRSGVSRKTSSVTSHYSRKSSTRASSIMRTPSSLSTSEDGGSRKTLLHALRNEKTITFAAESEADLEQWVKKLKVYLVQTELPSHLVMAQAMFTKTRTLVSGHRRRYVDGKFDLDLTYITSRIIAMAFPAEDRIGQFSIAIRNDLRVVKNFLDEKHPRKYKVFNLCAEKQYHPSKFDNNVEWIPFLDHNPPTLGQIKSFCYKVERWLLLDPDNVVAVHCKGGKGRTGLMIACYLLSNGFADDTPILSAREAVDFFADRRTHGGLRGGAKPQTVSGVSQVRCVQYFEEEHQRGLQYRRVRIIRVNVTKVPDTGKSSFQPMLRVSAGSQELYRSPDVAAGCCGMRRSGMSRVRRYTAGSDAVMELDCTDKYVFVSADFKVELFDGSPSDEGQKLADQAVCYACLHASKAEASPIVLKQCEVDQAASDVQKHKMFPPGFEIHIYFEKIEPSNANHVRNLFFNEDQQLWFAHRMVEECEPDVFESGETVLHAGAEETQNRMYLVGKGSVRLERGDQILQGTVGPLDIFGEQQFLLDNNGVPGDVVANLDPTILYPIDRQTYKLYFDEVGQLFHVLCIKLAAKLLENAKKLAIGSRVLQDEEAEETLAREQKLMRQLDIPVTERVLEQRSCFMTASDATGRQGGTMLTTHNFVIFKGNSLTSSTRIINLARVLRVEEKEVEGGGHSIEVNCFIPLSKDTDVQFATYTFFFASKPSSVLQAQLDARGAFGLSWLRNSSTTSWPFRADEALAELFQFMSPQQQLSRASFVRRSFSMARTASFGSRTAGDVVSLGSHNSIEKVKSWRADKTGAIIVSRQQRVVERYGAGELFGLAQYIDPSQKDEVQITAGPNGGAQLKVLPAEHLRQMLARDKNFRAAFWEYGAKVLAWKLRRGTAF